MRKTIDSDTCPKYLWLLMSFYNRKNHLNLQLEMTFKKDVPQNI